MHMSWMFFGALSLSCEILVGMCERATCATCHVLEGSPANRCGVSGTHAVKLNHDSTKRMLQGHTTRKRPPANKKLHTPLHSVSLVMLMLRLKG